MWAWLKSVKDGFKKRFRWKGKQPAEVAAEVYFKRMGWRFARFGWDRVRIKTRNLPDKYRFMPDYVVDKGGFHTFYEVKGMSSRQGVLRIKTVVYETLVRYYAGDMEVRVFAYALPSEDYFDIPLSVLSPSEAKVEEAHDGAVFMVFPWSIFGPYLVQEEIDI